jgi:DNA polymerase III alpha subunit
MKLDSLGIPQFTEQDLVSMIYNGDIDKCSTVLCSNTTEINQFNESVKRFGLSPLTLYSEPRSDQETFDAALQEEWFMPHEYASLDVYTYLLNKCSTDDEIARTEQELSEYTSRNMVNVLRYMIYLVDFMRENKIVWGVGRGSSVASFVLYLIGIHRINSIQYGLDFYEFMR